MTLGLLILLAFAGIVILLMQISDYLKRGKFDPIESCEQHIINMLESRELLSEQQILGKLPGNKDNKRRAFFYRKLSEVFQVEPGYLRHDDIIHNLTTVCLNDLGVFSGDAVFYENQFKYDTVDVFILELYYLFEDYVDGNLVAKDTTISLQLPAPEDRWTEFISSMTIGEFIEFLCKYVEPKLASKIAQNR